MRSKFVCLKCHRENIGEPHGHWISLMMHSWHAAQTHWCCNQAGRTGFKQTHLLCVCLCKTSTVLKQRTSAHQLLSLGESEEVWLSVPTLVPLAQDWRKIRQRTCLLTTVVWCLNICGRRCSCRYNDTRRKAGRVYPSCFSEGVR